MFVRLFRIEASESLDKSLAGAIYKGQNSEPETKRALDYLRRPKLVIATRESLFCKIFSPLFCFEQEKTLKNFSKKLYTSKIKKKRRSRDEKQRLGLKKCLNQHKSSNSQAVRGRYVYRSFFFSDHCIKQIDSMLPWVCSVKDHRRRQNVVKTLVTYSPAASVPLLCFYLPSPQASFFLAAKAFRFTWSMRKCSPRIRHLNELTERDQKNAVQGRGNAFTTF